MALSTTQIYLSDIFPVGSTDTKLAGKIRISAAALAFSVDGQANTPPDGVTADIQFPIHVSGTRKYGITARHIRIARISGTAPNQYRIYRTVPILDPINFTAFISAEAPTISYEGDSTWVIVGAQAERYHLFYL